MIAMAVVFDFLVSAVFLLVSPVRVNGETSFPGAVIAKCGHPYYMATILTAYKLPILGWGAVLAIQTRQLFDEG